MRFTPIAAIVTTAATGLSAGILKGDHFVLDTRHPNAVYALEFEGLRLEVSFLGDDLASLEAETGAASPASWLGAPAEVAGFSGLITALRTTPHAGEGLHDLLGRLRSEQDPRLLSLTERLLKATGFKPASEAKEEKKAEKKAESLPELPKREHSGSRATGPAAATASPGSAGSSLGRLVTQFGSLHLVNESALAPSQRALFNTHLERAAKAIASHIKTCVDGLKPAQRLRFPHAKTDQVLRSCQNQVFPLLAKVYPTQDLRNLGGKDLDWFAEQTAAAYVDSLRNDAAMALQLLGGDGPRLAGALETRIKAAFAR
jgi:hypothetical protein